MTVAVPAGPPRPRPRRPGHPGHRRRAGRCTSAAAAAPAAAAPEPAAAPAAPAPATPAPAEGPGAAGRLPKIDPNNLPDGIDAVTRGRLKKLAVLQERGQEPPAELVEELQPILEQIGGAPVSAPAAAAAPEAAPAPAAPAAEAAPAPAATCAAAAEPAAAAGPAADTGDVPRIDPNNLPQGSMRSLEAGSRSSPILQERGKQPPADLIESLKPILDQIAGSATLDWARPEESARVLSPERDTRRDGEQLARAAGSRPAEIIDEACAEVDVNRASDVDPGRTARRRPARMDHRERTHPCQRLFGDAGVAEPRRGCSRGRAARFVGLVARVVLAQFDPFRDHSSSSTRTSATSRAAADCAT